MDSTQKYQNILSFTSQVYATTSKFNGYHPTRHPRWFNSNSTLKCQLGLVWLKYCSFPNTLAYL